MVAKMDSIISKPHGCHSASHIVWQLVQHQGKHQSPKQHALCKGNWQVAVSMLWHRCETRTLPWGGFKKYLRVLKSRISEMSLLGDGYCGWNIQHVTMTSSNINIFRVTGPLCGEFTGHRRNFAVQCILHQVYFSIVTTPTIILTTLEKIGTALSILLKYTKHIDNFLVGAWIINNTFCCPSFGVISIFIYVLIFCSRNRNMYLHVISFLHTDMAQVALESHWIK